MKMHPGVRAECVDLSQTSIWPALCTVSLSVLYDIVIRVLGGVLDCVI